VVAVSLDIFNTERLCTAVWHRVDFFNDGGFFCSGKTADISPFKDGVVTLEKAVRLGYVSVHSSLMYRRAAQRFTPHVKSDIIDLFRTFDLLSAGYGKVLPDILGRYRVDASGSLTSNAMAKVRQLQVQHARFFYKEFPAMRQSFFIFAVSKLLVDALHLRKTTWDLLKFASTCFCFVSPIKVIENLRDMRRIQVG
jgi:hypothetical protein